MNTRIVAKRLLDDEWRCLLSLLPAGWEDAAKATGAFCWGRQIRTPEDLLRLVLAYAMDAISLRGVAAWAQQRGLVQTLSDVAVLKRLRRAPEWLGWMVDRKLEDRVDQPNWTAPGRRIRLVDATAISGPGSQGTDWRVHLSFGLCSWQMDGVELTDASGGETLKRVCCQAGDILIADRGYPARAGIGHVVCSGADVLVRLTWQNLPLQHPDGRRFDLFAHLRSLAPTEAGDWDVQTAPAPKERLGPVPGRLVALRKSEEAAEKARRRLRKEAKKRGKTPSQQSLEAAGYVFLFTTLDRQSFPAEGVLDLYRFRWQIELAFKRMKSLLHMGQMSAKCAQLCRTFLFAKLLIVLMIEDLSCRWAGFSPWGYGPPVPVPVAAVPGGR